MVNSWEVMGKKEYVIRSAKLLLLFISLLLLMACSANLTQPREMKIVNAEIKKENVNLSYPQLADLSNLEVQNQINEQIKNEVISFANNHNQKNMECQTNYMVEYNRSNLLSLTITEFYNQAHAAHPMTYLKAFTFDTNNGKILQLNDVFGALVDYNFKLNEIINTQISDRGIRLLKPFNGIKDNQEFYLTQNSLVVFYQTYEYTPYYYGILKFEIPDKDLVGMSKKVFGIER